ncbi:hypothetical protein CR513_08171, partial [Mucuna pruriens]
EAWDILNKSYGGVDKIKKLKFQSLCRQYELLFMNDQESIEDYLTKIQILVNSMKACSEKLRTLTPQFDHIVVAIKESKDLERMKVEEMQNSPEAHEQRLLERSGVRVVVQALQAQASQRSDGGGSKNKKGKWKKKLKDSNEGLSKCYPCQKWGHFANECYNNKEKQKKKDEAQMTQGDSDDYDSDRVLLMVTTSNCAKSNF